MTVLRAINKLKEYQSNPLGDTERSHILADEVLIDLLLSSGNKGYIAVAKEFKRVPRGYETGGAM